MPIASEPDGALLEPDFVGFEIIVVVSEMRRPTRVRAPVQLADERAFSCIPALVDVAKDKE